MNSVFNRAQFFVYAVFLLGQFIHLNQHFGNTYQANDFL